MLHISYLRRFLWIRSTLHDLFFYQDRGSLRRSSRTMQIHLYADRIAPCCCYSPALSTNKMVRDAWDRSSCMPNVLHNTHFGAGCTMIWFLGSGSEQDTLVRCVEVWSSQSNILNSLSKDIISGSAHFVPCIKRGLIHLSCTFNTNTVSFLLYFSVWTICCFVLFFCAFMSVFLLRTFPHCVYSCIFVYFRQYERPSGSVVVDFN